MTSFFRAGTGALVVGLLAACGSGAREPLVLEPAPALLAVPVDSMPPVLGVRPRGPEPLPPERWREPFAVAARGEVMAREPREVVVLAPATEPPRAVLVAAEAAARASAPATDTAAAAAAAAAPAPDRAAESAPPARVAGGRPEPTLHRVERGDTWYGLARRYGVRPADLARANPDVDPERIRVGQRLRIPAADTAGQERVTYRVRPGDSLWGIARTHEVSIEQLRRANDLPADNRIRVGQLLVIPREGN